MPAVPGGHLGQLYINPLLSCNHTDLLIYAFYCPEPFLISPEEPFQMQGYVKGTCITFHLLNYAGDSLLITVFPVLQKHLKISLYVESLILRPFLPPFEN